MEVVTEVTAGTIVEAVSRTRCAGGQGAVSAVLRASTVAARAGIPAVVAPSPRSLASFTRLSGRTRAGCGAGRNAGTVAAGCGGVGGADAWFSAVRRAGIGRVESRGERTGCSRGGWEGAEGERPITWRVGGGEHAAVRRDRRTALRTAHEICSMSKRRVEKGGRVWRW